MIQFADRLKSVGEYYFSKKLEQIAVMNAQKAVINLGIGNPDGAPSSATLQAAATAIMNEKNHGYQSYRGTLDLRKSMSQWYKKSFSVDLDPQKNVLPLLGSKEGVMYVAMACLNPGDGVLIPNPGYPAYRNTAQLLGAKIIDYDLLDENDWYPDIKKLRSQDFTNIKLMWINYPHMPTGQRANKKIFQELVALAKEKNFMLVNDNPYSHVLNPEPVSLLQFDPQMTHTMELNSLSKAFNMAGWRIGVLAAAEESLQAVLQVKSNVDTGMFLPLQMAAVQALQNPPEWHAQRNDIYEQRRVYAEKIFSTLGFSVKPHQA
ncbi:MAG: pyridoxal phosphate-dependent aminotransferase, partial [Pseudobdellovibrionaceae bacterium]